MQFVGFCDIILSMYTLNGVLEWKSVVQRQNLLLYFGNYTKKKQLEKISIREICQLAGYNRTTFYAYYDNIYDLLNKAVDHIFIPIKENLLTNQDISILFQENLIEKLFLTYFSQNNKYIELLFKRQRFYLLSEKMKAELLSIIKSKLKDSTVDFQTIEIILEYQLSAVLGVVKYWLQANKSITEKELINKIYTISTNGAITMICNEVNINR